MQPGRHLGSEEGILGSCSVVRKIMSVPCGAVSGDRSQMQPLLYGRLSFSAENSLPPSQTSSKTFSRYCGSLRLKRGEKRGGGEEAGGGKAFPLPPPPLLPPNLSGVRGGRDRALPQTGGPGLPSRPRPAANTPPSTGSLVQVSGGRRRAGPAAGAGVVPGARPPSLGQSRCLAGATHVGPPGFGRRGGSSCPRQDEGGTGDEVGPPALPRGRSPVPGGWVTERG